MSAALVAKLIEAGTPAELVAEVAMELARAQAATEILERRRSKDRERKRDVPRISEESMENAETAEIQNAPYPLTPPLKSTPDPKKITPPISPKPETKSGRGSRLPDDWEPRPVIGKAADMLARWPPGEVERELAKFRNYWLAKGGKDACKTNWQRTWINWLISADERKPRNGTANQPSLRGTRPDPALDLYRAAVAQEQRENGAADRGTRPALPSVGSG